MSQKPNTETNIALEDLQHRSRGLLIDNYIPFIPLKDSSGREWLAYITKSINTMAEELSQKVI